MRKLVVADKVPGRIFFSLVDDAGNKLATVLATPNYARIVSRDVKDNLALTPEERRYCQLEALRTLPR